MVGIKFRNRFLDLFPDTAIEFEINHPIGIIIDGVDQISGGYSFPIDIPLDGVNAEIIGHINRLDVDDVIIVDEYCEVWGEGILIFPGKLTIKGATNRRGKLFITLNEVKELMDTNLAALDLGGDRSIGADTATRLAHAKDTALNPLDHDYIFFPVLNPIFNINGDEPSLVESHLHNRWDTSTDEFVEVLGGIAMPFIRVEYLLQRIFAHLGYTLDNQWQTTDELRLITLYNNYNIYATPDEWSTTINLSNHVPYRQALEFVKAIIGTFGLGLYLDPHTKTILMIPFRDLILSPEADDWTDRAAAAFEYNSDRTFINKFRYDIDTNDDLSITYSGLTAPPGLIFGEGLTARILQDTPVIGTYYAIADNSLYIITPSPQRLPYVIEYQNPVTKEGIVNEYISPLIPMWNSWDLGLDGFIDNDLIFQQLMVPHIRHQGYSLVSSVKRALTSFRTMIYRGIQPADEGLSETYPMASVTRYNIRGEEVGEHSLQWDREDGIYNKFWKLPYEMLRSRKTVKRQLLLSIRDIRNFRFHRKYRIENQNYFITKLHYSISARGLSIVDAEMITTL